MDIFQVYYHTPGVVRYIWFDTDRLAESGGSWLSPPRLGRTGNRLLTDNSIIL